MPTDGPSGAGGGRGSFQASVGFALRGLRDAAGQRNLRIQLVAGMLAGGFAAVAPLAPVERALLLLCVFAVISAEAANTALEAAVDLTGGGAPSDGARLAKDAAAGAVLALAVGSVAVFAVLLEGCWERLLVARGELALPAAAALGVAIAGALLLRPTSLPATELPGLTTPPGTQPPALASRPDLARWLATLLGACAWVLLVNQAASVPSALVPGLLLALAWAAAPAPAVSPGATRD